jgi:metalloendopeptidase OMA1, mitochondrial
MIDMARADELALGAASFDALLMSRRAAGVPVLDASGGSAHPVAARVARVGKRIAAAAERDFPERTDGFEWRFVLIDDPTEVNALCTPGGKIAVFTGLLRVAEGDDAALAAVLAHEVAHAVASHGAEQLSFTKAIFAIQLLVRVVFDFAGFTAMLSHLIISLPYSRRLETEADRIGLDLMARACYDPRASPRMFSRLAKLAEEEAGGAKTGLKTTFFSTHPAFDNRIATIQTWIPDAQAMYKSQDCARFHQSKAAQWQRASKLNAGFGGEDDDFEADPFGNPRRRRDPFGNW